MGIDRNGTYNEVSSPAPTGTEFLTQYGAFVDALIDTAVLRLSVTGTDTLVATAEPFSLPATGYKPGMKFTFFVLNENTGPVTINIDGAGATPILTADGQALAPGALVPNVLYLMTRGSTNFRLLGATGTSGAASASRTVHDTTFVWNNTFPANTLIMVELWGAGGGGSTGSGGGGASYATDIYKAGDLPSTVTITIPAGGAGGSTGVTGGNATFGSLLEAFGGSRGTATPGGGGGEFGNSNSTEGGDIGGGTGTSTGTVAATKATTIHAGGGGAATGFAGPAIYGGGGGSGTGTGGTSKYGGNGGSGIEAGQRPGGGGGRTSNGGGGRCIVTVFGG